MSILENLEPKKVFQYFEEVCSIPHGSGNVEQISNYLVAFAKERNLFYIQDEYKNVIIIKEASEGYETEPTIILQGHMDMVAVHKPELDIDMSKEPLKLAVDGDSVYALGTSLGGDNGIAVAYALAILDAVDIKHPKLEVVLTVDEETGMEGAKEIDLSMLEGTRLLNLDSEDEGIFLTSCAGGARAKCNLVPLVSKREGSKYTIVINGLLGGHSGAEIHRERGNSNCLMIRLLYSLSTKINFGIIQISGGLADNAIPRETKADILIEETQESLFLNEINYFKKVILDELSGKDSGVKVTASKDLKMESLKNEIDCIAGDDLKKTLQYMLCLPNGVQAMSAQVPGLVETSLNLGRMQMDTKGIKLEYAVRSCVNSSKNALLERIQALTFLAGGSVRISGEYPGWPYREQSPLRDKMVRIYEEMYGETPKLEAIHAGLECGLIAAKINDLDCISLGPDMRDIHTTEETLSISSTKRVWEYLLKVLEVKEEKS